MSGHVVLFVKENEGYIGTSVRNVELVIHRKTHEYFEFYIHDSKIRIKFYCEKSKAEHCKKYILLLMFAA